MGKGGGSAATAQEVEPLKSAEVAVKEAKETTSRAQRMRQAVAGTFSRKTMSGYSGNSSTAGSSAKLGA